MPQEKEIEIYTDGCSLGNPGPGGYAALIKDGNREIILTGGEPYTTNNRMELLSVIKALAFFKEPQRIKLFTDSEYVLKGATLWLPNWIKRGFKNSQGESVKNKDLWLQLLELLNYHRVEFVKVVAHSGHTENERVDKLAKEEAKKWKKG